MQVPATKQWLNTGVSNGEGSFWQSPSFCLHRSQSSLLSLSSHCSNDVRLWPSALKSQDSPPNLPSG